jgi:hypothetical protein
MWMPHQMKMLNLEAKGLKMDPDGLYKEDGTSLMSAVVNLGGGTGSFVTDKFSSATHLIKEMGIVN